MVQTIRLQQDAEPSGLRIEVDAQFSSIEMYFYGAKGTSFDKLSKRLHF